MQGKPQYLRLRTSHKQSARNFGKAEREGTGEERQVPGFPGACLLLCPASRGTRDIAVNLAEWIVQSRNRSGRSGNVCGSEVSNREAEWKEGAGEGEKKNRKRCAKSVDKKFGMWYYI